MVYVHSDDSMCTNVLVCAFMFKVIYMCIYPIQTCPLDLYTDCFYENRKEAIDSRVQLLCSASVETLHCMLENVWTTQEGKVCSLVNWERFSSLKQAQVLIIEKCARWCKMSLLLIHT